METMQDRTPQGPTPMYRTFQEGTYINSMNKALQEGYRAANIVDVMWGRGREQLFLQRVATTDLIAFNLRGEELPKILFEAPESFLRGSSIIGKEELDSLEGVLIEKDYLSHAAEGFLNPKDVMLDPLWNILSRADQEKHEKTRRWKEHENILSWYTRSAYELNSGSRLMAIRLQPTGDPIEMTKLSMSSNDYLILPLIIESLHESNIVVQTSLPEYSQEVPLIGIRDLQK